jgi:ABC-type multidrug transport system permease subunit
MRYIKFLGFPDKKTGMEKLSHHRIDFLVKTGDPPYQYWISDSSPKGYLVEKMFLSALSSDAAMKKATRKEIKTREIRYLDWLFPGILAMNMMFSALWGVGYVIVRYRKNGVLKRLKATPLTAFEYCSAQLFSRILVLMFVLAIVWVGCDLIFDFVNQGSYIDLFVVFLVGSISMTSMGLVVASRGISEEFTSGIINFISWPMMFLSEVWFSLEGSPEWVIQFSRVLPLTHLLSAVRKIMNDGAQLVDVGNEIGILSVMAVLFLAISAAMFSWNK